MNSPTKFLPVMLLATLAGCSAKPTPAPEKIVPDNSRQVVKELTLGVFVPLTGGAAAYGQNAQRGVELAVKDFLADHDGWKVGLVVEDSAGQAATGTRAVQKLISADKADALLGDVTSGVTIAVKPIVDEQEIPTVSMGASTPNLAVDDFVFRTWPSDTVEAGGMARLMTKREVKKLAILFINNEYGLAMERTFKQAVEQDRKVDILLTESFEQGAREMRTQISHIKDSGAQAIYFIGFPEAAIVFGRGYGESGLSIPVYATSAFEDPSIPKTIGEVLDGTIYTKPVFSSPRTTAFKAAYSKAYDKDVGITSDTAYDSALVVLSAAVSLVAEGIEPNGVKLKERIALTKGLVGVSGTINFDTNGDVQSDVAYHKLEKGVYKEASL